MPSFGLQMPSFTFTGVPSERMFERIAETAIAAEDAGFDSFWVMDHYHQIPSVGPDTDPMLEAYTLLAGVAARTRRIKLGALVTGVTYRNPAFLAKVVTTLDIVSSGRAILGIGAAWNEVESRAYGYEWPSTAERFERLEDALRICRGMLRQDRTTLQGHRHSVDGAITSPSPSSRAARGSSSGGAGSGRRCGWSRSMRTCGTGSATRRRSVTSWAFSTSVAETSAVTGPRSRRRDSERPSATRRSSRRRARSSKRVSTA